MGVRPRAVRLNGRLSFGRAALFRDGTRRGALAFGGMAQTATRFAATRKRPNVWVLILIAVIHLAVFYGLLRALAPSAVASVEDSVVSAFTVTVTAPEPDPPPDPEPDAGVQGDPGEQAVPKPVAAPSPRIPVPREEPAPRASSTGDANTAGAADSGAGTGRAGTGEGTGSGTGGSGRGGGAVIKPVIVSGAINSARDFPVPAGGREARIGTSVIVKVTVTPEGRATNCSVYRPSPFPDTDATVCRLVVERLRFRPATDAAGNPVAAPFYYQQRFFN